MSLPVELASSFVEDEIEGQVDLGDVPAGIAVRPFSER
jgi:hypothetical protein